MRRLGLVVMLVLAGCTDSRVSQNPTTVKAATSTTAKATTTAKPTRCVPVPDEQVAAIASGLDAGLTLRRAQAVKSTEFNSIYMVAADLEGHGLDKKTDLAVWALNRLDSSTSIFAVDSVANEFSSWGDARKTDARMTIQTDGVEAAKDCSKKLP